jgi:hypothetical protein
LDSKKKKSLKKILKTAKKKEKRNKKLKKPTETNIRINHGLKRKENERKTREILERLE